MTVRKSIKGLTLSEMLAYLSISLIILFFASTFIINSLRYYRLIDVESTLQQRMMVGMQKITQEMNMASRSSLIIENDGIIFASARNDAGGFTFNNDGSLVWQKWICIFIQRNGTNNRLIKKEITITSPGTSPGSPPYTTISEFSAAAGNERLIADGAGSFKVESAGYAGGYKINVELDKTTDTTKPNLIKGETEVLIRN